MKSSFFLMLGMVMGLAMAKGSSLISMAAPTLFEADTVTYAHGGDADLCLPSYIQYGGDFTNLEASNNNSVYEDELDAMISNAPSSAVLEMSEKLMRKFNIHNPYASKPQDP